MVTKGLWPVNEVQSKRDWFGLRKQATSYPETLCHERCTVRILVNGIALATQVAGTKTLLLES